MLLRPSGCSGRAASSCPSRQPPHMYSHAVTEVHAQPCSCRAPRYARQVPADSASPPVATCNAVRGATGHVGATRLVHSLQCWVQRRPVQVAMLPRRYAISEPVDYLSGS